MTPRKTAPSSATDAGKPPATGRRRLGGGDRTVTPLYHQMYLVLRGRIRDGAFPADTPMPGEHQLAEQFGVSRVTVRRTLEQLELEGLVVRRRGVGTFATPQTVRIEDRFNIGRNVDPSVSPAVRAETATLGVEQVPAPPAVAARFGGAAPDVVRLVRRRTLGEGRVFTLMTAYVPMKFARLLTRRQLQTAPIIPALEDLGVELRRAEQSVTACAADEEAVTLLDVPVGSPLLAMSTLFADRHDVPVLLLEALYRPDRFEYRTAMLRQGHGQRWRVVR